jgi:Rrf2 family protein
MFSRKAKYALIATISLAGATGQTHRLISEIAQENRLPHKFLEVILLDLRHAGLLASKKGRGGGYALARDPREITMADVIRAIDGPLIPFRCVAIRADKTCEECLQAAICPIGPVMADARAALEDVLARTSLHDLAVRQRDAIARQREKAEDMGVNSTLASH